MSRCIYKSPEYIICPAAFINVAGDILYPRDTIHVLLHFYTSIKSVNIFTKHSSRGHCPIKHTNKNWQFHHTVTLSSDTYFDPFMNCLEAGRLIWQQPYQT